MSDAESSEEARSGELTPPTPHAEGDATAAIPNADTRAIHLERARKLSRRLGVQVAIDDTGWLRNDIELVLSKQPDGTIRPVMVRVGCDAEDDAVLRHGGVMARCVQYNAALAKLRQLAEGLAAMVRDGRVTLASGSPVEYAHRELSRLDALIARRQAITMGCGVVRITTLRRELAFFARCDAHLAPIVLAAQRAANVRQPRDPLPS